MTSNVTSHTSALLGHTPEHWKMKAGLTLPVAELMASPYSHIAINPLYMKETVGEVSRLESKEEIV